MIVIGLCIYILVTQLQKSTGKQTEDCGGPINDCNTIKINLIALLNSNKYCIENEDGFFTCTEDDLIEQGEMELIHLVNHSKQINLVKIKSRKSGKFLKINSDNKVKFTSNGKDGDIFYFKFKDPTNPEKINIYKIKDIKKKVLASGNYIPCGTSSDGFKCDANLSNVLNRAFDFKQLNDT